MTRYLLPIEAKQYRPGPPCNCREVVALTGADAECSEGYTDPSIYVGAYNDQEVRPGDWVVRYANGGYGIVPGAEWEALGATEAPEAT